MKVKRIDDPFFFFNKRMCQSFLINFALKIFFNIFGPFSFTIIHFNLKFYFIHISLHDFERGERYGRQKIIEER